MNTERTMQIAGLALVSLMLCVGIVGAQSQSSNQTGISNPNASLILPNPVQTHNAPIYIYVPIMTTNATLTRYILTYAPIALQDPLVLDGTLGKNFSSYYTFQGQMEYADLGKILLHYNSSLSILEENTTIYGGSNTNVQGN